MTSIDLSNDIMRARQFLRSPIVQNFINYTDRADLHDMLTAIESKDGLNKQHIMRFRDIGRMWKDGGWSDAASVWAFMISIIDNYQAQQT